MDAKCSTTKLHLPVAVSIYQPMKQTNKKEDVKELFFGKETYHDGMEQNLLIQLHVLPSVVIAELPFSQERSHIIICTLLSLETLCSPG